jgi:hypothetical protein
VERRTDACIGLRADYDESPDSEAREHGFEGGVLEGVAVVLLDERLDVDPGEFGNDPPVVASFCELLVGVLDPDNRDPFPPRLRSKAADLRDDLVAFVGSADDAVLYVDDEERGLRPVLECGDGPPLQTPRSRVQALYKAQQRARHPCHWGASSRNFRPLSCDSSLT